MGKEQAKKIITIALIAVMVIVLLLCLAMCQSRGGDEPSESTGQSGSMAVHTDPSAEPSDGSRPTAEATAPDSEPTAETAVSATEPAEIPPETAEATESAESTAPEGNVPQPTEPAETTPKATDPKPTDSQPTDPEPTDPKPTDPKPTDPEPTDAKPTDPSQPGTVTVSWPGPVGHAHVGVLEKVVEPTCTEAGYSVYVCQSCGDKHYQDYTQPLGHSYVDTVTKPTCTSGGYTTHKCVRCGDSYTDNETPAAGHSYSETVTKEATCTEFGIVTYKCSVCGDSYTQTVAGSHSWEYQYISDAGHWGDRYLQCDICGWYVLESQVETGTINLAMQDHLIDVHGIESVKRAPQIYESVDDYYEYGSSGSRWDITRQWISEGSSAYWKCTKCGAISQEAPCDHQVNWSAEYESYNEESILVNSYIICSCGWVFMDKDSHNEGDLVADWGDHTPILGVVSAHSYSSDEYALVTNHGYFTYECAKCGAEVVAAHGTVHEWHPISSSVYSVWRLPDSEIDYGTIVVKEYDQAHNWVFDEWGISEINGGHWFDYWKCSDCGLRTQLPVGDWQYIPPTEYRVWECSGCGAITFEEPPVIEGESGREKPLCKGSIPRDLRLAE